MTAKFEIGKEYEAPYSTFEGVTVLARTEKTVTLDKYGKKKIFTNRDGNEYVKVADGSWRVWANKPFIDPEIRKAMWELEEAEKKEADRQARLKLGRIPEIKNREVPKIDKSILMAWAIGNDVENLVKFATSIKTGNCMICKDTRYSHCDKILYFEGFTVYIHDGNDDVYTYSFNDSMIYGSRHSFEEKFKIEESHPYKYGFHVTEDGVWKKNGEDFQPDWEFMNC